MTTNLSHGGKLIERCRKKAGLTQTELGRRAGGVIQQTVYGSEQSADPNWKSVVRLLRAAGFTLEVVPIGKPTPPSPLRGRRARLVPLSPSDPTPRPKPRQATPKPTKNGAQP